MMKREVCSGVPDVTWHTLRGLPEKIRGVLMVMLIVRHLIRLYLFNGMKESSLVEFIINATVLFVMEKFNFFLTALIQWHRKLLLSLNGQNRISVDLILKYFKIQKWETKNIWK